MAMPFDTSVVCPVIIGRTAALASIELVFEQVRNEQGQTVLVSGEAGIGKSRFVLEAKTRIGQNQVRFLQGNSFEQDRSLPFAPILDVLRTPPQPTPTPEPSTPTPTSSEKPVSSATISITGSNGQYAFSPQTITVSVGATVSWKNTTSAPHSISALIFGGGPIPQGGTFSHTYKQAGTFEYWDAYHPSVKGTVIVH